MFNLFFDKPINILFPFLFTPTGSTINPSIHRKAEIVGDERKERPVFTWNRRNVLRSREAATRYSAQVLSVSSPQFEVVADALSEGK